MVFCIKMPRSKTGKKREKHSGEVITEAVKYLQQGHSAKETAEKFNVPKSTLFFYAKNNKDKDLVNDSIEVLQNDVRKIFDATEENELNKYLEKAALLKMGLGGKEYRELAYEFALKKNKGNIPDSWHKYKMAGIGWLRCFRERNPQLLSLRKPEATSLARATSFNKFNVNCFFDNLQQVMEKYKFPPECIFNLDETGISTVHKPPKILAPKSIKRLGKVTSGERGINNTMIGCINAIGNSVPPLIVFPRVFFKEHMLKGAPPGSVGAANPSGWSTEVIFRQYLDHFIKVVKPSKEKPVLLIMDNHESHISIAIIDKAKENGIVLLTLPPHTSDNLQPLDRCVYGPLKNYYNKAADKWMLNHPGKPISIYDIAEIIGEAYLLAFTPSNIVKSFEVTGICPFNRNIFTDDDFLGSHVTDRPQPLQQPEALNEQEDTIEKDTITEESPPRSPSVIEHNLPDQSPDSPMTPVVSKEQNMSKLSHESENKPAGNRIEIQVEVHPEPKQKSHIAFSAAKKPVAHSDLDEILVMEPESINLESKEGLKDVKKDRNKPLRPGNPIQNSSLDDLSVLESIRPFRVADPRKMTRKGRKPGRTRILTDTPEKQALQEEALKRDERKRKSKTKKTSFKKIKKEPKVIKNKLLPYVACKMCKKSEKTKAMKFCTQCKSWYHQRCISKSHQENFESDDENGFICEECFVLEDDDNSDGDSEGFASEMYQEYLNTKKNH